MKKTILMSAGLSALLLSSPVLAKSNHVSLNVNPITGNQTSVNGEATKLATIKVLHNKTLLGNGTASKNGAFKVSLKAPIKNGWKYTIQATKKGFGAKKYTVTALYASTKTDQIQSNNYQNEIHDLQSMIVSLQSQVNDLKNKQSTTTVVNSDNAQTANAWLAYQKQIDALNNQISENATQFDKADSVLNDIYFYKSVSPDDLNNRIEAAKQQVDGAEEALAKDPTNLQKQNNLNMFKDSLNAAQQDLIHYNKILGDIKNVGGVDSYLKSELSYQQEEQNLSKELTDLNNQVNDLQQKQAAVLNSLS